MKPTGGQSPSALSVDAFPVDESAATLAPKSAVRESGFLPRRSELSITPPSNWEPVPCRSRPCKSPFLFFSSAYACSQGRLPCVRNADAQTARSQPGLESLESPFIPSRSQLSQTGLVLAFLVGMMGSFQENLFLFARIHTSSDDRARFSDDFFDRNVPHPHQTVRLLCRRAASS